MTELTSTNTIPATVKKFKKPKLDRHLLQLVALNEQDKEQARAVRQEQGEIDNYFENFQLEPQLLHNLFKQDFYRATDIQYKTIPLALEKHDILGCAATGTGKTLAYLIPAIQHLYDLTSKTRECKVLVVAPTRDLVTQIYEQAEILLAESNFRVAMVIGSESTEDANSLENVIEKFAINHMIISTPGRLSNHLQSGELDLSSVEILVIDEADRTLEIGLRQDLALIDQATKGRLNTLLFSATLNHAVDSLFNAIALNTPVQIMANHSRAEKNKLIQCYYHCDNQEHKLKLLINIIKEFNLDKTMVFVKKKEDVTRVYKYIMNSKMGVRATQIDGDMSQEQRQRALGLFKDNKVQVIVTTDLLARGIDIEQVKAVINFDLPYDGDTFVHRIGRTGRMGAKGLAISLVQAHDYQYLGKAMRFMREIIPARVFPGLEPQTKVHPDALSPPKKVKVKKSKEETAKKDKKKDQSKTKLRQRITKNKGYPKKFLSKHGAIPHSSVVEIAD